MRSFTLLVFFAFFATALTAQQELEKGFRFLESGDYGAAKTFFANTSLPQSYARTSRICYARAIGLGGESQEALDIFKELAQLYPNDQEVRLNLAEAHLWNNQFVEAKEIYQVILEDNSNSFVANYGYANAQAALDQDDTALLYMHKALSLEPNNNQALVAQNAILLKYAYHSFKSGKYTKSLNLLDAIDARFIDPVKVNQLRGEVQAATRTRVDLTHYQDVDSESNTSRSYGAYLSFMMGERHRLSMTTAYRQLQNAEGSVATQQKVAFSDAIKLGKRFQLNLGGGVTGSAYDDTNDLQVSSSIKFSGQVSDKLYSELSFARDILDYNFTLLESRLVKNQVSLAVNYMFTKRLGLYLQLQWQLQSDDNLMNSQVFSLYYSLSEKPLLRLGSNASFQSYQFSDVAYFSPAVYAHLELFILLEKRSQVGWQYSLLGSVGQQDISDTPRQTTYKAEAKFGYLFKSRLSLLAELRYNTAAQVNTAGAYEYTRYGLHLSYSL